MSTPAVKQTRKQYAPQFKFNRVLEAIRSDNLSEISRKYNVSVNVISAWRSHVMANGAKLFTDTPDKEVAALKAKVAKLEQMLGKKEVELNVLKNFSDFYESRNTV